MGLKKTPTEGGSGGKRGHSNMEHWVYTEEIKDAARAQRRIEDRIAIREDRAYRRCCRLALDYRTRSRKRIGSRKLSAFVIRALAHD